MSPLTPEQQRHVQLWIDALESDEYRQTTGKLRDLGFDDAQDARVLSNEYCCLGVACEVWRKETGIGSWKIDKENEEDAYFVAPSDQKTGALPWEVRQWLGLDSDDGTYMTGSGSTSLVAHNDSDGWDFKQIAQLLKDPPSGLFV